MNHRHSRAGTARAVAALAALLLAGGCGMYGDLYLEQAAPPPAPQTAPGVEEREPIADDAAPLAEPVAAPAGEDPRQKPKQAPPDSGAQATGRP